MRVDGISRDVDMRVPQCECEAFDLFADRGRKVDSRLKLELVEAVEGINERLDFVFQFWLTCLLKRFQH